MTSLGSFHFTSSVVRFDPMLIDILVGGDPCTPIFTHEILLLSVCLPTSHGVQTLLPSLGACLPGAHTSQTPFRPTFPFGQLEHCTLPLTNVVIPALQVTHFTLPGELANLPILHSKRPY